MSNPQTLNKTPAALGYSMPAEWAPHAATWFSWPHNLITWPDGRLARVEEIYLEMITALLPGERVHVLFPTEELQDKALQSLKSRDAFLSHFIPHLVPTVDAWIRDYGPTFVTQKAKRAWCKWIFNAWGGKYEDLARDTQVFSKTSLISEPCFDAGFILEGGSIEVNGVGTCMTTEQCLLNTNRNSQWNREQIEEKLKEYLGVSHILWLGEGIVGDDTDGHIDDIARFVAPDTILSAFEDDPNDANYGILKENWERLEKSSDQDGKKWNLIKLPMPGCVGGLDDRLPASYANFYIGNKVVLVPTYGHANDEKACRILKECFPDREIRAILCEDLVYGLGAIHCVSQQEPLAP